MLDQIFRNMTPVVKNLLILNVLFYLATYVLASKGIDLVNLLSSRHYSNPDFQPYQLVTSMFMHLSFSHIFMNMIGLLIFGGILEKHWGSKKFLIFYFFSGFSAEIVQVIYNMANFYYYTGTPFINSESLVPIEVSNIIGSLLYTRHLGASGAIFGLSAAIFKYFPNSEWYLMFIPIPIKMKNLFPIMIVGSIYLVFYPMGMNIGHIAHLGGALGGFILVLIWQKDKRNFY